MKIAVCFKIVLDETELVVNRDKTIDESKASYIISPYDCNAVGAAMNLAANAEDSQVIAVTAGDERVENGKMRKGILSRGPSAMVAVKDESLGSAESYNVAAALKAAIEKIGDVELVICGEGSGDLYNQVTGSMLGAMMGLPVLNGVCKLEAADGAVKVDRMTDDGFETLLVSLPAVISVTSDICIPKIPSMKEILAAGKKPCTVYTAEELGLESVSSVQTMAVLAPESAERKRIIIKGDGEEQVSQFYNNIRRAIS